MEVVMLTQDINSLFSSLGCPIGEDYIIGDECEATLQKILLRLYEEDKYVRGFRRLIANSQVLKKDLLPLFYNVKNDCKITDLIIQILENLMIPVECLLPIDIMIKEDAGRSTICQLNWLLTACKEAFLHPKATKAVIDYIKLLIKEQEHQLTTGVVRSVAVSLQLLRNLLHIPEVRGGAGTTVSHQNQIVWNLFTQHIDKVLVYLMSCGGQVEWSVTIVQLISLLYKDQQSNTIYRLLNVWCDTAISESSEDDESNTSPQDRGSADSSSSMVTSDPTSDSSDGDNRKRKAKSEVVSKHHFKQPYQNRMTEIFANGIGRKAQVAMRNKHGNSKHTHPLKHRIEHPTIHCQEMHTTNTNGKQQALTRMCWSSESGLGSSDGGSNLLKMECDPEPDHHQDIQDTSTSSNEDKKEPSRFGKKKNVVHQKALHMIKKSCYGNGKSSMLSSQARKELCRKKLFKRSKATTMGIKAFLNHIPSEDDISQLMQEFTVDFLLKGYRYLMVDLKKCVMANQACLDTSHFTWLIMFFLRYATLLELDLELISPVLSFDILAYLTYEGVNLCEELEVAKLQVGENLSKTLQKLYLTVASLKEILHAIEAYRKMSNLSHSDRKFIKTLQDKIAHSNDLKHLFLLLLRHFDPLVQSHQFLQDVVVANHYLLVLMDSAQTTSNKALITDHIKQFASEEVMKQYGVLLACFEDNGEAVNDCIFTMMHHIVGHIDRVSVLFQPSILKSFTRIIETDFKISDVWSDLVEYVVQKCLRTKQRTRPPALSFVEEHFYVHSPQPRPEPSPSEGGERPAALNHYKKWTKEDIESLSWYFPQSMEMEDLIGHINKLFEDNGGESKSRLEIIENLFMQGLIHHEEYKSLLETEDSMGNPEIVHTKNIEMDVLEGIQVITAYLHGENCGFFVKWVQNCLLEACYARLVVDSLEQPNFDLVEPVAYFYTMLRQPVPLVTWNQELWRVMQLEPSVWLLSALNFHLPTRAGHAKIFARIPIEWTADHMYVAALCLGPIDSGSVKFDPSRLQVIRESGGSPDPTLGQASTVKLATPPQGCLPGNSSLFGYFLGSSSTADWLQKVQQLKISSKVLPQEDKHERMSMISGDERDWDLTSMCVSDEGARHSTPPSPLPTDVLLPLP